MPLRHRFRHLIARLAGVQDRMEIHWTPGFPILYVNNPKCGCSTIKTCLKTVQADAYVKEGRNFHLSQSPHAADDCLRRSGFPIETCQERYVISCVRNPFARALSGYLDKVEGKDPLPYGEFRGRAVRSFDDYLRALVKYSPVIMDMHFRPQSTNLDYPRLTYDAIFYLEHLSCMARYLSRIVPGFELRTHAPHSRNSSEKLRQYYTDFSVELVREIYAQDFASFGYSESLDDADLAPGELIANNQIVKSGTPSEAPARPAQAPPGSNFERVLRFNRLVELRII